MDIVIPLGSGSKHKNLELRYALRSIEEHFPFSLFTMWRKIFLVGERPDFIHNVIHIPGFDNPETRWKEQNIFLKVMAAIDDPRLSDDFILFNDDHFLLEEFDVEKVFFKGRLDFSLRQRTLHESYANTIRNTLQMYPNSLDYDVHCPMVMNRNFFRAWVAKAEWHLPFGFSIQSLYGNGHVQKMDAQVFHHEDCKIRRAMTPAEIRGTIVDWKFFSIADEALNDDMKHVLQELYPNKSSYEL